MTDYIINPYWFYWADVVDTLKSSFQVISILSGVITAIALIIFFIALGVNQGMPEDFKDDTDTPKIISKIAGAICIFTLVVSVFIPSKKTLTEMLIAENVTKTNIEYAEQEIKDIVDYVFDKFEEQEK